MSDNPTFSPEVIRRLTEGEATPEDLAFVRLATRSGQAALALGERSLALGGSADGAVLITGNGNLVVTGPGVGMLRELLRDEITTFADRVRADRDEVCAIRRAQALDAYLHALRTWCERLPYQALRRGALPALSTVYIEQRQDERASEPAPAHDTVREGASGHARRKSRPESLEGALLRHLHVVIESAPGLGKSTLLQHFAATLINELVRGTGHVLPICVQARALALRHDTFSASLHAQASSQLTQLLGT